jgi:hypothetical protein
MIIIRNKFKININNHYTPNLTSKLQPGNENESINGYLFVRLNGLKIVAPKVSRSFINSPFLGDRIVNGNFYSCSVYPSVSVTTIFISTVNSELIQIPFTEKNENSSVCSINFCN